MIEFDASKRKIIKLDDNNSIIAEGMSHIVIQRNDGKSVMIKNVLLVRDMQYNLLSVCQLVQKGFLVLKEADYLKIFYHKRILILKGYLSRNRTFKVCIQISQLRCLAAPSHEHEVELWHKRYGHLNYKSLSQLISRGMVIEVPKVQTPESS